MINKYKDFISEQLMLESNIVYSDKFKLVMNKIGNETSKKILELENKDIDVDHNYYDIDTLSNDKITFINDKRAKSMEILYNYKGGFGGIIKTSNIKVYHLMGIVNLPQYPYLPSSSEVIKVIKRENIDGIEYALYETNGEEGICKFDDLEEINSNEQPYWIENRQEIKVGRAIRTLLKISKIKYTDSEIEEFVNKYKAIIDQLSGKFNNFELVSGSDILKYYKHNSYLTQEGNLGKSCMKNSPSNYFDIYVENPEVCQMLILKSSLDNNKIIGRALLWTLDSGEKLLDRIYTEKDSDVELFKKYARGEKWYSKFYNNNSQSTIVVDYIDGDILDLDILVRTKPNTYKKYPYMDTLKFWCPVDHTLTVDEDVTKVQYKLESMYGAHESDGDCKECEGSGFLPCDLCSGEKDSGCDECDNGMINCDYC